MSTTKHKELQELKRALYQKTERLNVELARTQDELDAVKITLDLLNKGRKRDDQEIESKLEAYVNELNGLTQVEALVKLAKNNRNQIKTKDAKRILVAAGL